jgi:hypothetical protein
MSKAKPMSFVKREIGYTKQNGSESNPYKPFTPAQQRRIRQKNNKRLATRGSAEGPPSKKYRHITIKPRAPWGTGTWVDPFGKIKVPPHTFGNGDQ